MGTEAREPVSHDAFAGLDIRVGTIVHAEVSVRARRPSYRLHISFGPLGLRTSSAQLTERYTAAQLVGRKVLAVVNMPPRQVADVMSEVLVLGVTGQPGGTVLLVPHASVADGSPVR
jgi:tRNA-binding protein